MKSAVAPNVFATKDVSIGTRDRNARRVQSLQVLIKIIRSYSAEILRLTLLFLLDKMLIKLRRLGSLLVIYSTSPWAKRG